MRRISIGHRPIVPTCDAANDRVLGEHTPTPFRKQRRCRKRSRAEKYYRRRLVVRGGVDNVQQSASNKQLGLILCIEASYITFV